MRLLETSTPSVLQAVVIFLTVLSFVAISLRLYTRRFLTQSIKTDDWFSLAAYVFNLGLTIYFIIGVSNQYIGYPIPEEWTGEEEHSTITGSLQHFYVWNVLLFVALWLIKCSVVIFYRRVLVADKSNYRDWANILMVFSLVLVTIWSLAFGLAWTFACNPVHGFWSFPYGDAEGPCMDTWKLNRAISISDFLVDLFILLIPIPLIWRLRMPTGRKLAVLIVFFLGAIAVVASIMRMVRVIWASSDAAADTDGLLINTTIIFWGMIEAHLGLLAACLPTLRGLLKTRTVDSLIKSYRSRTWLRSTQRSSKSSGEHDSLPLTESPVSPAFLREQTKGLDCGMIEHDVVVAKLDSVAISDIRRL